MSITSVGYAGTVGDAQWAEMMPRLGATYSVNNYTSFRVTAAAGTRTVQVAAGSASGWGVYATSDSAQPLTLASVPSGTRWDMIVLRRNWATKETTIAVVQGGSAKALPGRNVTPGTLDDQPLALVRLAAGSTSIQEIVDLRCAANNNGLMAWDDLARSYLTYIGTSLRIDKINWYRMTDGNGSAVWISDDMTDTGWVNITKNSGWSWGFAQVRRIGKVVFFRIGGATRTIGWSATNQLASGIPASMRPDLDWFVVSSHNAGKTEFRITTTGQVLASGPSNGATSVTLHGSYPVS